MRETRVKELQYNNFFARLGENTAWRSNLLPLLLLLGACVLWAVSLPNVDPSKMNDFGLVSVLPGTFFIALALLAISFLIVLHRPDANETILAAHILVFIFMLHATPQIVYGTVRYSWAWKHVGIVDYIQRNGSVNPSINNLDAYHNWPGFFALAAFYNSVAGLPGSLGYAGWGPFFFNLLDFGALLVLFRSLTTNRRLVWLSIWFFYLFSWVGQDYFSPQAFSYFFYLVILAVILRWFGLHRESVRLQAQKVLSSGGIARLYQSIVHRAGQDSEETIRTSPGQRLLLMLILVLIFFVIASSHQLTPVMVVSALTALVLFRVTNQRYLPLLMGVITVAWTVFMAVGFLHGNLYWIVESIGSLLDNFSINLINLDIASPGQQFIATLDRILSVAVWILGLFGFYRRYRLGHWDLAALLLAFAPLPIIAFNSYGGEMLFRVYLFSLPFITFLAAGLFYPATKTVRPLTTSVVTTAVSLLIIPAFLFAYYGKDRMYYFSPNEVAAAQYIYERAPKGTLIVDSTWNWPRMSTNYEYYNYLSLLSLPRERRAEIMANPVAVLAPMMEYASSEAIFVKYIQPGSGSTTGAAPLEKGVANYPAAYFIVTRSQIAEAEMTGVLPHEWFSSLIDALSASDHFKIVLQNPDAVVFEYVGTSMP
jgi:hypothetical protein